MTTTRVSRPRPSTAWLRLSAATVFAAIPAIGLPVFIDHLYRVRPHVTDARGGFVLPHFHEDLAYYFAHSDEVLIKGLSFWLLAAVLLLMIVGGQMMRRRLKIWLRPPRDVITPDEDAAPQPGAEPADQIKT